VVNVLREPLRVVERGGDAVERREDAGDARGQDEARAGVEEFLGLPVDAGVEPKIDLPEGEPLDAGSLGQGAGVPNAGGRLEEREHARFFGKPGYHLGDLVRVLRFRQDDPGEPRPGGRLEIVPEPRGRRTVHAHVRGALRAFSKRSGRLPGTKR
jgi:hypothetical protein